MNTRRLQTRTRQIRFLQSSGAKLHHLDRSSPALSMMGIVGAGRGTVALTVIVVVVLVAGAGLVGGARPEPAERSGDGSAVYAPAVMLTEKARETVEMLMPRLPAGPSNRGAGH
ncbi:hypothetical protein D1007_22713 [Hordeum vulgare]|nr:hypothetical protein D1007_22713 [Hordeum vulgare]